MKSSAALGRARPLLVLLAFLFVSCGSVAGATNSFRWSTNYYTVTGTNLAEIHESMNQARPWKDSSNFVGLTDWRIQWSYEVVPTPAGCRCSSFTTRTTILTTLPRWTPPDSASREVKAAWQQFITALGEHEMGHARLALAALADMHRQVKGLGEPSSCEALGKSIESTARRVVEEHRKRDREYDLRTNHGANQGAALRGRMR